MIQREIGDRLAVLLLEGKAVDGATVTVDADSRRRDHHLRLTRPNVRCRRSTIGPPAPKHDAPPR